ncbi:MAG: hypothetical protein GY808_00320 [Gammaproteobacteria bacterium]|nr:hypothetical protein [Gammaproteobacteria bacterium]
MGERPVVTDHYTDEQQLCFEKQSPDNPAGRYYQLKPCDDLGEHLAPVPFTDIDHYSPSPIPGP